MAYSSRTRPAPPGKRPANGFDAAGVSTRRRPRAAVERGLHAMLVGPRGTGKSLWPTEAAQFAHRALLTVEGHESIQPVDLLGGYIPDQSTSQPADPLALQAELACRLETGKEAGQGGREARHAWAEG